MEGKFKKLDDKVVSVLSDIKDEKKKIGSRVNSLEEHFIKFKDLVIDEINSINQAVGAVEMVRHDYALEHSKCNYIFFPFLRSRSIVNLRNSF